MRHTSQLNSCVLGLNARQGQSQCFTRLRDRIEGLNSRQTGRRHIHLHQVHATAVDTGPSQLTPSKETDFQQAVAILKQAAKTRKVPGELVIEAMVKLGKQNLANESYADILGGGAGGKRWQLIFSAGAKKIQKAYNKQKAGGIYFPLTAAQSWEKDTGVIENGVYLGQIAALVFNGPYEYKKNKLSFDFNKLKIRFGPKWFSFDIKSQKKDKAGPFFIFYYADEEILVAKGRGGGVALWLRTTPAWELKNGIGVY